MLSELLLIDREASFLKTEGRLLYGSLVERLKDMAEGRSDTVGQDQKSSSSGASCVSDSSTLDGIRSLIASDSAEDQAAAEEQLLQRLSVAKNRRVLAQHRRVLLARNMYQMAQLKDRLLHRINQLQYEYDLIREHLDSLSTEELHVVSSMKKLMQMNAINDAFFIWYSGPFATINNFRLGNLPTKVVEWTEINAALGQAVLAVAVVAQKAGVEFKKFCLVPMGSFSKVSSIDDRRAAYSLFTDGSFSLFPKRNFNTALLGFLACVQELGDYVVKHDPTLSLPYPLHLPEGRVHDQSVLLGGDEETWTRGLKFLLADVKWIIAWATKHLSSHKV